MNQRRKTIWRHGQNEEGRMMDPDLLLEPERLGIQMLVPTGGRSIHFSSGLIVHRHGHLQENPVAIQDRAVLEREKKILMYEMILRADQDANPSNVPMCTQKSVFDIYTKGKASNSKKLSKQVIVKYLEEQRKIVEQIKEGGKPISLSH